MRYIPKFLIIVITLSKFGILLQYIFFPQNSHFSKNQTMIWELSQYSTSKKSFFYEANLII